MKGKISAVGLSLDFFARDTSQVAQSLLGKVIFHKVDDIWLAAQIIETESYYRDEKGSHSSLGYSEKKKAVFMPPGTIYMYYSRGGDSLNISTEGEGNAVLIKSGYPFLAYDNDGSMIAKMRELNPARDGSARPIEKLCSGQTLLCKSLGIKVRDWDQQQFDPEKFFIADVGYAPKQIILARRLGIPPGRDEHLLYRFIDFEYVSFATENPLRKRNLKNGTDYHIIEQQ